MGEVGEGEDERVALVQSGVALLVSLLTEPLRAAGARTAALHTASRCTPPSSVSSALSSAQWTRVAADRAWCGVARQAGWQAVLNTLNRCELSWRWKEWKQRAGLDVQVS